MEQSKNKKRKALFIINPISGVHNKKGLEELISSNLDKNKFDYSVKYSEAPGHAIELASQAVKDGVEIIIAVGGDGTVNEVGQALVGTSAILGIIPCGSGNGLARHLKISTNRKKAIDVINKLNVKKIDTATVNGKVFISIAGLGYDAYVARQFSKASKRGFFTYFRIVSEEYIKYQPKKYTLEIDGKTIQRKALLITLANSNQFGNNVSISPRASVDDGFIDVCIVRRIPVFLLPFYVPMLFLKTFNKTHYIEIIRAKSVIIHRGKNKSIHLDGDPYRMGDTIEMTVNPQSLNIIFP
ncbi:MAG: diacylglycerol kinase family lipid kinase [Bacteroidota bacterium]|nr:diacylglycerol kinase family lipid kinase [Bacteroidota bacterium]